MKIKAIIFDFDGLMFDTEKVWQNYFFNANKIFDLNFTEEDRIKCMGTKEAEIRERLKKENPTLDVDAYREWLVSSVKNHIETIGVEKKKGLDELLMYIKERNILAGIASGSSKDSIVNILKKASIDENLFSSYITTDVKVMSKPSPDVFLKTCENLGVKPEEAIVLEDSYNGVRAGHSAGCFTIMIPDTLPVNEEMKQKANLILNDLTEVVELLTTKNLYNL